MSELPPEPIPERGRPYIRAFGSFMCVVCDCHFADRIPPIYVDLPMCPSCGAASWIYGVLVNEGEAPRIRKQIYDEGGSS